MFEPPYILFVNTKRGCDVVARGLDKMGHTCAVLHSGRSQDQRESAIASFKQVHIRLICIVKLLLIRFF